MTINLTSLEFREIYARLDAGQKGFAISRVRQYTGATNKEAKAYIETLRSEDEPTASEWLEAVDNYYGTV